METFDLILDNCLAQLASGAATLDECLARYPGHAAQLRPLLQTAARFERVRNVQPSPTFKARARAKLTLHMQAHPRRKAGVAPFLRVAFAMAALALVFLSAGTAFAQSALPGDMLYRWKLTSENLWRAAASDSLAADLFLANRRVDEMIAVAGDAEAYALALEGYRNVLARLAVRTDAESQAQILAALQAEQELLAEAGLSVPELDAQLNLASQNNPEAIPDLVPSAIPEITPTVIPQITPTAIPQIIPTVTPVPLPSLPVPTIEIVPDIVPTLFP